MIDLDLDEKKEEKCNISAKEMKTASTMQRVDDLSFYHTRRLCYYGLDVTDKVFFMTYTSTPDPQQCNKQQEKNDEQHDKHPQAITKMLFFRVDFELNAHIVFETQFSLSLFASSALLSYFLSATITPEQICEKIKTYGELSLLPPTTPSPLLLEYYRTDPNNLGSIPFPYFIRMQYLMPKEQEEEQIPITLNVLKHLLTFDCKKASCWGHAQ